VNAEQPVVAGRRRCRESRLPWSIGTSSMKKRVNRADEEKNRTTINTVADCDTLKRL